MFDAKTETFIAVCKYMNYTKAAQELNISQPAVTQHIQNLEKYYNTKLIVKNGRNMRLTSYGQKLIRILTRSKSDEALFKRYVTGTTEKKSPLRLGLSGIVGPYKITAKLAEIVKRNPQRGVTVLIKNADVLQDMIRKGQLHLALLPGYFNKDEFDYLEYSNEQFICVCSTNHVFAKTPRYIEDLMDETVIVNEEGSGLRDILERNLNSKGLRIQNFKREVVINNMAAILDLTAADCGITFLYERVAKEKLEQGLVKKVEIENFNISNSINIIWSKDSEFRQQNEIVCKYIIESFLK